MPDIDDTAREASGEGGPDERAREGLEHLQAAARELIHAARAMLDVAEDLVNDPETVASAAGSVGTLGELVRQRAGAWPHRRPAPAEGDGHDGSGRTGDARGGGPGGGGPDDPGLERITVR